MKKEDIRFSFDNISWLKKKQKNNAIEENSEQAQVALLKQLNIQLILTRKLTEKSLTYDKDKKQYVSRDNKRVNKQSAFDIRKSVFLPQKKLNEDEKQKKQSSELPSLVKNVGMVGVGIGIAAIIATYAPMMWPFVKGMLKQMLPTFITEAAANISEIAEKFIGLFKEGGAVYDAIEWFKESTEQVADFLSDMNPFTSKDEKEIRKKEKEIQKELKKANKAKPDLSKSDWAKDDTKKISDKKNDDSKSQTNELEQNQNIIDKETEEFSKDTDEESGKQPESETQQQSESGTPQSGTPQQQSESGTQQPESRTQQQPESRTLEQPPPPTPEIAAQNQRELNRSSNSSPKTQPTSTETKRKGTLKRVPAPTTNEQQQSRSNVPVPTVSGASGHNQPPAITQPTPSGTQPSSEPASSTSSNEPPITPTNLNSVMDTQQGVIIDRFVPEFDKRLSMMAAAFQKETGKKLLATSGFRSNEKQKQLWDAKLRETGGNVNATRKWVAEPTPPLGGGTGSQHMKGLAIDINPLGAAGINVLAGKATGSTGWLEKFGLIRPIAHEDWHVQPSEIPPSADNPSAPGKPIVVPDASGNPTNVATGQKLNDISVANQQEKNKPTTHNVIIGVNTTKTAGLQKNA